MKNRDDILITIKSILVEMFEVDEEAITLEARLNEDLDFDSIDAVDMMIRLREMTGKWSNLKILSPPVLLPM